MSRENQAIRYKRSCKPSLIVIILFLALLSGRPSSIYSQELTRIDSLGMKLDSLATQVPGLKEMIMLTVSEVELQELIRNLASTNRINISIDQRINYKVTNNFVDVSAKDVLLYLCREYDLDLIITGRITTI